MSIGEPRSPSHRRRQAPARPGDAPGELGRLGERLAAEHLARRGFSVLERNVRTRAGEIDLIAFDGRTLVFVEVKTTRAGRSHAGQPWRSPLYRLGPRQQARLRRLAGAWLAQHRGRRPWAPALRLDAVGVTVDADGRLLALDHLESAW
jgi:putative endonuclease